MLSINVPQWSAVELDADLVKRLISGRKISASKIRALGPEHAEITGSGGVYDVTLDACTCADYSMRRAPCKHMLRVALDAGLIQGLPADGREAAARFREAAPAEAARYIAQWLADELPGDRLAALLNALKR